MSALSKFQFDFTPPAHTAPFTLPKRLAQPTTLPVSEKSPSYATKIDVSGMIDQWATLLENQPKQWTSTVVQTTVRTIMGQLTPTLWEFDSTGLDLVDVSSRGQRIQRAVEVVLGRFQSEGLISAFEHTSMTSCAVVYSARMPQERWTSEDRERLHAAALDLQEQHDVVVLFELRRERVRAERP